MLAVLCGSLLVARLSAEVGQGRWRALSDAERQRLSSSEHWFNNLKRLKTTATSLGEGLGEGIGGMAKQLKPAGRSGVSGKKWVRPEDPATLEAPLKASPEAPVEDQVEAPIKAQAESQVEAQVESQVESPVESPVEPQAESPVEADPKPESGPESEAREVED